MSCKVNDDNHKFICSIDETENGYKLQFYKKSQDGLFKMVSDGESLLLIKPKDIQDGNIISECFVDNKLLNFDFFIDNSWVKYDRG